MIKSMMKHWGKKKTFCSKTSLQHSGEDYTQGGHNVGVRYRTLKERCSCNAFCVILRLGLAWA